MTRIKFSKMDPLPAYEGPRPVYLVTFPWAGAERCYARKGPQGWETAEYCALTQARFSTCPVSECSNTRHGAVMAFDYYHNRL